jgi:hypothetical protein
MTAEGQEKIELQSVNMESILYLLCLGKNNQKACDEVQIMQKCFDMTCLDWKILILIGQIYLFSHKHNVG